MEDHGHAEGGQEHAGTEIDWGQELMEALRKVVAGFLFAGVLMLFLGIGWNQTDKWMVLGIGISVALWAYPHLEKAIKAGA